MSRSVPIAPHPFLPPRRVTPGIARHVVLGLVLAIGTAGCLALLAPAFAAGQDARVTDDTLAGAMPWAILGGLGLLFALACSWIDRGIPMRGEEEGAVSDHTGNA